jgi:glutamyl-tRNA reductase
LKPSQTAQLETLSVSKGRKAVVPKGAASILLLGTSFKTSSLAFREALAFRLEREAAKLPKILAAREYAQLVTCNRIEIVIVTDPESEGAALKWLSKTAGFQPGAVYVHKQLDAITHLFRVAAGLDSMVIGEEQILAQVKDAGIAARTSRSSRGTLSSIFDASVNVGRRARSELSDPEESVSSMALKFALSRLPAPPKSVLLIGTGKTTRLAAEQLRGGRLYVATRRGSLPSFSKATLVPHAKLKQVASKCDLILSATKHEGYVLSRGDLDGRRRVVLDLAFPRNVDPALNSGATEVYNLEDLARVIPSYQRPISPEARRAEELVAREAEGFSRWLHASRQSSALSFLYQWAESTRRGEADAAIRRLPKLSAREKKVVEAMSRRLVSKLLAPPTGFAKSSSPDLPQEQRLDLVQRIFEQGEK